MHSDYFPNGCDYEAGPFHITFTRIGHIGHHLYISVVISLSLSTAGYDYTPGPYTVDFTAGQLYATLMVSTMDDSTTELTENFKMLINSTDQPGAIEKTSPNKTMITIEDNDPGICIILCLYFNSLPIQINLSTGEYK